MYISKSLAGEEQGNQVNNTHGTCLYMKCFIPHKNKNRVRAAFLKMGTSHKSDAVLLDYHSYSDLLAWSETLMGMGDSIAYHMISCVIQRHIRNL